MVVSLSVVRLCFVSAVVCLLVLSSILMLSVSGLSRQEEAASAISEADQSLAQAYNAVLEAERVGADVSGLLVKLNDAVGLLSEARKSFELGSFDEAVRFAQLSIEGGRGVVSGAESLEVDANSANVTRFWWFLVGSVLGLPIVVLASFVGYRYFKRLYYRRLLKMRPRVGQA